MCVRSRSIGWRSALTVARNPASSVHRTYRLAPGRMLAYLIPGGLALPLSGFLLWYILLYLSRGRQPGEVSIVLPVVLCLFTSLLAAYCILNVLGTRLAISAEGVAYHTPFGGRSRSWSDVLRIGDISYGRRNERSVEGLILSGYQRPAGASLGDVLDSSQYEWITLAWFDPGWEQGEIGEQVRGYAPHLFEDRWPRH